MENPKENEEKECSSDKHSCCSGGGCCCGKALIVFIIFLLGGIIGYLIGMHGGMCHNKMMGKWSCPMGMSMTENAPTQAQPPAK